MSKSVPYIHPSWYIPYLNERMWNHIAKNKPLIYNLFHITLEDHISTSFCHSTKFILLAIRGRTECHVVRYVLLYFIIFKNWFQSFGLYLNIKQPIAEENYKFNYYTL